jgi:hypothetical protein
VDGGVGGDSGKSNGGCSERQQSMSKLRGAPASKANTINNRMNEDGEGPKVKYRKI